MWRVSGMILQLTNLAALQASEHYGRHRLKEKGKIANIATRRVLFRFFRTDPVTSTVISLSQFRIFKQIPHYHPVLSVTRPLVICRAKMANPMTHCKCRNVDRNQQRTNPSDRPRLPNQLGATLLEANRHEHLSRSPEWMGGLQTMAQRS